MISIIVYTCKCAHVWRITFPVDGDETSISQLNDIAK